MYGDPRELEMIEREEREAREALAAAREQQKMDEGEAPHEHHKLIHRLEEDWKKAAERLKHARGS